MRLGGIVRRSGELFHQAWSYLRAQWIPLALGGLFVAAVFLWFGDLLLGEKPTLGSIVVGSPAIYTRERLVNDRFLQDAWLAAQLQPASGIQDSRQIRSEFRGAIVRAGDAKAPAGGPPGSLPPGSPPPGSPQDVGTPHAASPEPRLSSRVQLLEEVDYREIVRNLTIENQLDDRHDLKGNSLYKFRFDASVLPGANTQASALIEVRLISPEFVDATRDKDRLQSLSALDSRHVDAWRHIYHKWIDSLRFRLNQTYQELKQGFENNDLSHNDYAFLIAFLVRSLRVFAGEIPKCPGLLVDPQSSERAGVRMSSGEHIARKQCLEAIVERSIPESGGASPPAGAKPGAYISIQSGTGAASSRLKADRSLVTRSTVEVWVNAFFAIKTIKLVLGVTVRELGSDGLGFYDVRAFQKLARLTFFNGPLAAEHGNAFQVDEKVFQVPGIDSSKVSTMEEMLRILETREEFAGQKPEDFVNVAPAKPLRVSRRHLEPVTQDDMVLSDKDFLDVSAGGGIYRARAELGLLNFVREARRNVVAFTYGVAPKESADSVDLTLSAGARVEGHAPAAGDRAGAGAQLRRDATSRTLERRTAVVGFSRVAGENSSAEFGWVISPRLTSLDGLRPTYVQMPAQYALSALVSIPSWWNTARFTVTTSWVSRDGTPALNTATSRSYEVDVPMDFEPLEALLLGIEQIGPELMESSRLDPIRLTACRPGAIVIPGRRLWRSTKVTLGYQTANAIAVLPNMKGIVATFEPVQNQMSVEEESALRKKSGVDVVEIQRAVRVWTSQGSLTLSRPAIIGIPAGTTLDCSAAPTEKSVASKSAPGK